MTVLAINHPFYIRTVSNLERTAVRDKLLRLVQYFSRFLSYYLHRKGYSADIVRQLKSLNSALSLARKAFRAGKPLQSFRAALIELGNHTSDRFLNAASIVKNLGSGFYLTLDTIVFLASTKTLRFSNPRTAKRIGDFANRFWLLSIVAGLADAVYRARTSRSQLKALAEDEKSTPDEKKKAIATLRKQQRLVVWNVLDALIPMYNLGFLKADDGIVGLAGTITSYFGVQDLW